MKHKHANNGVTVKSGKIYYLKMVHILSTYFILLYLALVIVTVFFSHSVYNFCKSNEKRSGKLQRDIMQ